MGKRRQFNYLSLLFTSLLFVTSSYAWLSSTRVIGSNTFNIYVASKGGVEISTDAINWKNVISLADLINARSRYPRSLNQIPYRIEPVSSSGEVEAGKLKIFHGTVHQDFSLGKEYITTTRTIEEEGFGTESDGKFIVFDLFFKVNSKKKLYIDVGSQIASTNFLNYGIENAFRVAFLNEGVVAIDATILSMQNINDASTSIVWEPNFDVHTQYAVQHAKEVYNINTSLANASRIEYYGVREEISANRRLWINETNLVFNRDKFKVVPVEIATSSKFNQKSELLMLEAGVNKIRTYIWIEGQDVDCENNASLADVSINLQLTTDY